MSTTKSLIECREPMPLTVDNAIGLLRLSGYKVTKIKKSGKKSKKLMRK